MNEHDYHLMEYMSLSSGSMILATIAVIFYFYGLAVSFPVITVIGFIAFMTFFFGLYFNMKRKVFIRENEALLKQHRGDKIE